VPAEWSPDCCVSRVVNGAVWRKSENMPFTDGEWDEVSQTIPKPSDPFIQKYLEGRDALIAEEAKQRTG
jgi:hypothetical protein